MASKETSSHSVMIVTVIIVALIAFGGGWYLGSRDLGPQDENAVADAQGALARGGSEGTAGDSSKIPIGDSAVKGKADAPITVIEFSDFQCPFCGRGASTLDELQEKYPNDVKIVFKHFPLAFHKEAPGASKAAMAAGEQGKFWEMHDLLFKNQKAFRGADMKELTAKYAADLGLDVEKFKKDFDKPEYQQTIDEDMKLGQSLGVRGTPHFFVNGERISGAQPLPKFESVVKEQLEEIKKMKQSGVARDQIYAEMVKKNYKDAEKPTPRNAPQAAKVQMVDVRPNDPAKGNTKDPLVTIVEFSDFECPFCTRVNPTIDQVMKNYGDKVRVVFKQNPLPMHPNAPKAHEAALAANEQGKFWEMHDLLFENQKAFRGADMESLMADYAGQLGLNQAKFKKAMESGKYQKWIKEDQALAAKVGARGTPNFFINGVQLVGAQPYPSFEAEIKKQIEIAEKLKKEKNLSGDTLYKAVVEYNKANAPKDAPQPNRPSQPEKVDTKLLNVGDSYTLGPKNAPVTIYEFSDFQCPFCNRGAQTVKQVVEEYGDKVRVVFKSYPLPFHKEAKPASIAAYAAGRQGKFWEMHDLLFANQQRLRESGIFEEFAQKLGLDMAKFKKDMADPALAKQVDEEMKEGTKVGVSGTPAFFINGTRLVGAQPLPKFKEIVDAALK